MVQQLLEQAERIAVLEEEVSRLTGKPIRKRGRARADSAGPGRGRGRGVDFKAIETIGKVPIYQEVLDKIPKDPPRSKIISALTRVCGYKKNTANQKAAAYVKYLEGKGQTIEKSPRGRPKGTTSGKKKKKKRANPKDSLTLLAEHNKRKIWKEVVDALPKKPDAKAVVKVLVEVGGYKRTTARTMSQDYLDYLASKK
jgi:hypothetical protein